MMTLDNSEVVADRIVDALHEFTRKLVSFSLVGRAADQLRCYVSRTARATSPCSTFHRRRQSRAAYATANAFPVYEVTSYYCASIPALQRSAT
jgi:hypothetical protein